MALGGKFWGICAVGLVGSVFIGYCVYFDRKRRSDPDYKKKVLARERKREGSELVGWCALLCRETAGEEAAECD